MAHFYGVIDANNRTKRVTRTGHKATGLTTLAAGWGGAVRVELYETAGKDYYTITLEPWEGSGGVEKVIAAGLLETSYKVQSA